MISDNKSLLSKGAFLVRWTEKNGGEGGGPGNNMLYIDGSRLKKCQDLNQGQSDSRE